MADLASGLGRWKRFARRELRGLPELLEPGEEPLVAAHATLGLTSWVVVATDRRLLQLRAPWAFGRVRHRAHDWSSLRAVQARGPRLILTFGDEELALGIIPGERTADLVDIARGHLHRGTLQTAAELRELARTKLGRFATYAHEAALIALPDHLAGDEVVQRMAVSDKGLLVVTSERVLLLGEGGDHRPVWQAPRAGLRLAVGTGHLRLVPAEGAPLMLHSVLPPGRADELRAVLRTWSPWSG